MSKKIIFALIILALTMVVLLFNMKAGQIDLNLVLTTVKSYVSVAYLGFTFVGVVIGLLLK